MDNRRNEPNLKLINMEQVEIEKIDWLLYPFIPFGKVTIVQGDPGEGKTTMVLQIIAKLTKGEAVLPSGSDEPALEGKTMALEPVNVIYQTAEAGLGDTIKELKNSGQIKLVLPEAGALELASTYRNKKIKPLFAKIKNYVVGLVAEVIELSREAEKWRDKYQ